jgi:hypothetical protein
VKPISASVYDHVTATHQQNSVLADVKQTSLDLPIVPEEVSVTSAERSLLELPTAPLTTQDVSENTEGQRGCGDGMRLVDGEYCTTLIHQCLEPFTDGSGRCQRYVASHQCSGPKSKRRFCIDQFEYPNRFGEKPIVMVDYNEASAACAKVHKRLCTESEWTLACEGPEKLPYPYGYERDPSACNIDRIHRFPDTEALYRPETREAELRRIDESTPSGTRPKCVSGYGVFDMTGNVDEWVSPEPVEGAPGVGRRTVLKGGYYGVVRARCRPSTASHGPTFKFYQVGFRCCSEATESGR